MSQVGTENKTEQSTDKVDTKGIVRYLSFKFNEQVRNGERGMRVRDDRGILVPNEAYRNETEFAYLLNEIARGPTCMIQRNIAACEEFITNLASK
jgi:hypothetical protein